MKARVLEEQADCFEVAVLSLTAEVQSVSAEQLLATPSGPPLVVVGGLFAAERLADVRRLSVVLARAGTSVLVAPPFADVDLGRYFETPVQLLVRRRAAESTAHVVDAPAAAVVGDEANIRSDHCLDTALGAGVIAVDIHGKPVLIRYQASNTQGPVFFSALQLLSYTALTNESQRQRLLTHLLSQPVSRWPPNRGHRCSISVPTARSVLSPKASSSPSHCCSRRVVHKPRTSSATARVRISEQISARMR